MHESIGAVIVTTLLSGALVAGIPLLYAALGESIAERSGVLNIGIEGIMLVGAYTGFLGADLTQQMWLGFVVGGIGGAAVAIAMVVLCVRLGLDQIVVGIALTVGAEGVTSVLQGAQFGTTYPRLGATQGLAIPVLSQIPVLGPGLFDQPLPAYLAFIVAGVLQYVLRATSWGLNLKAAGEQPAALDASGVSVIATRAWAELTAGALIGFGGAYLAISGAGIFVPFMTHGQGFIALVIAMLARGNPPRVVLGALIFGGALSLQTVLQLVGLGLSTDVINMVPFVAVMVVLLVSARHSYLPPALGRPFTRGAR